MEIEQAATSNDLFQTLQQLCFHHQNSQQQFQQQQQNQQQQMITENDFSNITEEIFKAMMVDSNQNLFNQQQQQTVEDFQQSYLKSFNILNQFGNTSNGANLLINSDSLQLNNLAPLLQTQSSIQNQQKQNSIQHFKQLNESTTTTSTEEQMQIKKCSMTSEEEEDDSLKQMLDRKVEHQTDQGNESDQSSHTSHRNNMSLCLEQNENVNINSSGMCKKEEEFVKKDFSYETILKQVYNPLALQALHGDIFIDLNYDYANSQLFGQPSLINQYKQVISVENFEEKGLVEINIQSNYNPVYQFQSLTQALCNHPEINLQELGSRLQRYQNISQRMLEKGQMCKSIIGFSKIQEMMVESYKKFEIKARQILSELKKTNKLFIYSLRQLNLENFGFEIKKYGYSAEFLQLLGYNIHQFKNLAVRKGLIELQNFKGRIALNKMTLDLLLGDIKDSSVRLKTSYITSDNLELQVDGIVKQVFNTDSGIQNNILFTHSEFLSIVILDVNTDTMKQIYTIRQASKQPHSQNNNNHHSSHSNKNNSNSQIVNTLTSQPSSQPLIPNQQTSVFGGPAFPPILPNSEEIDVDEYYSMETQILIEKFYEDSSSAKRKVRRVKRNQLQEDRKEVIQLINQNQHVLQSKTCGYRVIKRD
ncbi:hypothetical protein ABPG74_014949 [Tetrahymena malaccensis]